METEEFKKLLLNIAVCAISCDGHVDDLEIKELHLIEEKSPYFSKVDLSDSLNNSIDIAIDSYDTFQESVLGNLNYSDLNIVQEPSENIEEEKTQIIPKKKMKRNEPCFCGSGKKYKHCCGSL